MDFDLGRKFFGFNVLTTNPILDEFADIFNSLTNNRLAPVPEEQTEELLKAIEFPMIGIGSMDSSGMQDMMSANSSTSQQSVIQGTVPMRGNQQADSNSLLYTATIYSQDMSAVSHNNQQQQQQQMMAMHQNRQQQNESSNQAMMSDLNPFISGGLGMTQQQVQQAAEQMMPQNDSEDKEAYKGKYLRGYSRAQLP